MTFPRADQPGPSACTGSPGPGLFHGGEGGVERAATVIEGGSEGGELAAVGSAVPGLAALGLRALATGEVAA
jgi:hypothetical protein